MAQSLGASCDDNLRTEFELLQQLLYDLFKAILTHLNTLPQAVTLYGTLLVLGLTKFFLAFHNSAASQDSGSSAAPTAADLQSI